MGYFILSHPVNRRRANATAMCDSVLNWSWPFWSASDQWPVSAVAYLACSPLPPVADDFDRPTLLCVRFQKLAQVWAINRPLLNRVSGTTYLSSLHLGYIRDSRGVPMVAENRGACRLQWLFALHSTVVYCGLLIYKILLRLTKVYLTCFCLIIVLL